MASCFPGCPYCDPEPEPEFWCYACLDVGWLEGPGDTIIPCTECSLEVELVDLEETG